MLEPLTEPDKDPYYLDLNGALRVRELEGVELVQGLPIGP